MEYQITEQPNWHRVVTFNVSAAEVKPKLDEKYEAYTKNVRLEGFRKGHVPPGLIKKMFGKNIESDVFNPYIRQALDIILKEHQFDFLNSPGVETLQFDDVSGLSFAISFDIRPDFQVSGFQGMEVEHTVYEATDHDMDHALDSLRSRQAMIYTVDGEAREGHFIIGDLQEIDRTGIPVVGEKFENEMLWLSADRPEITTPLLGTRPGDERTLTLQPPADPATGEQRPEKYYQVRVKEVKERRLPELDDEFARDMGPFTSLDELKMDIRQRLESQAAQETRRNYEQVLADALIKEVNIEAPPSMVENYLAMLVADVKKNSKDPVDENEAAEHYRPSAIHNVKWYLIRDRLLTQEGLAVNDDELDGALAAMADSGEEGAKRAEQIKSSRDERERFRDALEDDKVYDFLGKHAKISENRRSLYHQHDHEHDHDHTTA